MKILVCQKCLKRKCDIFCQTHAEIWAKKVSPWLIFSAGEKEGRASGKQIERTFLLFKTFGKEPNEHVKSAANNHEKYQKSTKLYSAGANL